MSSKKSEDINNIKSKDNHSLNNSKILSKSFKNIYDIPVSTALTNLLDDLSDKQKKLKKQIENQRNTILEIEKKRYYLSSKMFPFIESRYNKINIQKNSPQTDLNNKINKKKGKILQKSRSEVKINFDNKILSNNLFQTSLNNSYKPKGINMSSISTPKITSSFNNQISNNKNNMILNLSTPINQNNKEISKINYISSSISILKKRRKKYTVNVIKGWEFKHGFNTNSSRDKSFVEDKVYQKNLISNQIEIIIDNTNFFKLKNANILEDHIKKNNINIELLIKMNQLIEETSGLYIEIGHLIINDYESFNNIQNNTHQLNPPEMNDGAEVFDEKIEFTKNVKILNECIKFLTITYEIYLILNNTSEYILPTKKLIRLRHFLNRARYNINCVNINSKKYIETIEYENNIVNLYNSQKKVIENNEKLINKQYFNLDKSFKDGFENFREKDNNEYGTDKIRRLNNLLNGSKVKNNDIQPQKKISKKWKFIDFEDKMFNKLFKYMEPDIKDRFEAFSVTQKKHKDKEKFERKVYKFNF